MTIKVICKSCRAVLKAPEKAKGKSLPCPKCKETITVPWFEPPSELELLDEPSGGDGTLLGEALASVEPQQPFGMAQLGAPQSGYPLSHGQGGYDPAALGQSGHDQGGLGQGGYGQGAYGQGAYGQGAFPGNQAMPFGALPQHPGVPGKQQSKKSKRSKGDSTVSAAGYGAIGGGIALIYGLLLMLVVSMSGPGQPKGQNVAQAERGAGPPPMPGAARGNVPRPPAQPSLRGNNTPRPSTNIPGDRGRGNRPGDSGSGTNSGTGNSSGSNDAPVHASRARDALKELGLAEFTPSGEFSDSRTEVTLDLRDDVILLPMRTWKLRAGEEHKAMLKSVPTSGKITLLTDSGDDLEVDLDKLDLTDRAYVSQLITRVIQTLANHRTRGNAAERLASESPANTFPSLASLPIGAAVTPDVLTPFKVLKPISVTIPQAFPGNSSQRLILSQDRSVAMVVEGRNEERSGRYWLQLINARRGQLLGTLQFQLASGTPFAITSDDKAVFFYKSPFAGRPGQIDKWGLDGDKLLHLFEIELPNLSGDSGPRFSADADEPDAYGLANDETLYLIDNGKLALIDLNSGDVLFADNVQAGTLPAFSANKRYMAFQPDTEEQQILILNCKDLELAGKFPAPLISSLAFNDDGDKLAMLDEANSIKILDSASGEVLDEFPLPDSPDSIYWSGNQYIVTVDGNKHTIIDLPAGCPVAVWNAGNGKPECMLPLGESAFLRAAIVQTENRLYSVRLPEPAWIPQDLDSSPFYSQFEGQSLSLDLGESKLDESQQQQVSTGIEKLVTAAGGSIAAGSQLRLVCKTRPGGTQTMKLKTPGSLIHKNVDYETVICEISLFDGDKKLWQEESRFGGPTVTTGTPEEVSKSAEGTNVPNVEFFTSIKLPRRLLNAAGWQELKTY